MEFSARERAKRVAVIEIIGRILLFLNQILILRQLQCAHGALIREFHNERLFQHLAKIPLQRRKAGGQILLPRERHRRIRLVLGAVEPEQAEFPLTVSQNRGPRVKILSPEKALERRAVRGEIGAQLVELCIARHIARVKVMKFRLTFLLTIHNARSSASV